MNIDPQNNKSDQIFSHNYLVRPRQSDPGESPEKVHLCEVSIILFPT